MKLKNIFYLLILTALLACKSSTTTTKKPTPVNASQIPLANGKDQTSVIQEAIDKAGRENKKLTFPKNQNYKISSTLQISCMIDGQNSKLIPTNKNSEVMRFTKEYLTVENLHIESDAAGYIQVNKAHTTFKNCRFDVSSYFILFSVNADNLTLTNCHLSNKHSARHQYAIHSISSVNNLKIEACYIYGGILLENTTQAIHGNHTIKNSEIVIDYTHAEQSYLTQHDGITLRGINTMTFSNNLISMRNVNRAFKLTDIVKKSNPKEISKNTTTNILFQKNKIESRSTNGKQVFDLYAGTGKIQFLQNEIISMGHTTVFENKTTEFSPIGAHITIKDNKITFDFKLLYVNGGYLTDPRASQYILILDSNQLINNNQSVTTELLHKGQDFPTPLGHLLDIQHYHEFRCDNNKLTTTNGPIYSKYYFLYLGDVKNTIFTNNTYQGGIVYDATDASAQLLCKSNTNDGINLVSVLTAHRAVKGSVTVENNTIMSVNPKIGLNNDALKPNVKQSNNTIRQL